MSKTILYLFLVLLLGGGVWYFLFYNREGGAFSDEAAFSVKDTASIGKIFLADNSGNTITLTREPAGWRVNGQYAAAPLPVNVLLKTLQLQEPLSPVAKNARNNVIRQLAGASIKTEVYDRAGRKLRTFFVGGESNAFAGTFMLMDGSETPYIVQIPGFNGYLTPRYTPDLKTWRDRAIMTLPAADIRQVSVAYPGKPVNNYTITRSNPADSSAITVAAAPELGYSGKPVDLHRARAYFRFFNHLYAEAITNGNRDMDSILRSTPQLCTLTVQPLKGPAQTIATWRMAINRRSKNLGNEVGDPEKDDFDADRLYAVYNNGKDTAIIQYRDFDKVMRMGYEFFGN